MTRVRVGIALALVLGVVTAATAQPIGTFRFQLEPFCNLLTLAVTQNGTVFRLEGTDDQCGAATAAGLVGLAFINPGGEVGFGINVVASPGGSPVHIDATISIATLNGTWRDSAGNSGAFTFRPAAATGGSPRPAVAPDVRFRLEDQAIFPVPSGSTVTLNTWPATPIYNVGGGTYNAGAGTYAVPTAGLYLVTTSVRWQNFAVATGYRCVYIYLGGSLRATSCDAPSNTATYQIQPLTTVFSAATGNTVNIRVFQNSGAAATVGPDGTSEATFTVTRLR